MTQQPPASYAKQQDLPVVEDEGFLAPTHMLVQNHYYYPQPVPSAPPAPYPFNGSILHRDDDDDHDDHATTLQMLATGSCTSLLIAATVVIGMVAIVTQIICVSLEKTGGQLGGSGYYALGPPN